MKDLSKKGIRIIKNLKTIKGGGTLFYFLCYLPRKKKKTEAKPPISVDFLAPQKGEHERRGPGLFGHLPGKPE